MNAFPIPPHLRRERIEIDLYGQFLWLILLGFIGVITGFLSLVSDDAITKAVCFILHSACVAFAVVAVIKSRALSAELKSITAES